MLSQRVVAIIVMFVHEVRGASSFSADLLELSVSMQLIVDVLAFVLVLTNALHQPYHMHMQVAKRLQRDGLAFYVVRCHP